MPSRLSSLLVRDGLIGVKRMERAFQRQVIYGGALDTILLEMSLIDEASLCDYLSLATGLPPATKSQMEVINSEATDLCPLEMANQYRVAPLAVDGDALRVIVCEPVDFAQLEDLADALDMAVQPLVAPEFRFNILLSRAFATPSDARYAKLAEVVAAIEPSRRPSTSEIDKSEPALEPADEPADVDPIAEAVPVDDDDPSESGEITTIESSGPGDVWDEPTPTLDQLEAEIPDDKRDREIIDMPLPPVNASIQSVRATMKMSSDAVAARLSAPHDARKISDAYRIVRPVRTADATGVPTEMEEELTPREVPFARPDLSELAREAEPLDIVTSTDEMEIGRDRGSERFSASYNEMNQIDAHGVISGEIRERRGAELGPLSVADAESLLADATDRDVIFSILLRGISRVASHAGLLAVQGTSAFGRMALIDGEIDSGTMSSVHISLEAESPWKKVNESASPYIGRLASGVVEVDREAQKLGGTMPATALLLPVVLRGRVIAIVLAHRGGELIEVTEASGIFRLAEAAAEAILRLIRTAKKNSPPAPAADPADAPFEAGSDASDEGAPAAPALGSYSAGEVHDAEIEELLDAINGDDAAAAAEAKRALLGRSAEVVPLLDTHFPGRLRVDRYEVAWRTIRASQYGEMMDLVVQMGAACGPMLAQKLRDPRRDIRYYAAVCAAELRPEAALDALVERVFDRDYGVRDIAIHALGGYPVRELDRALAAARRALDTDDGEKVIAASNALSVLGDLAAIPALLDVIEHGGELVEPARRALRRLTAQDFGASTRKWRQWWEKNRGRPRVEWLLESLSHKDDDLRRRAVEDLRALTGESFGYHADASKRDREHARRQWMEWWESNGRQRFSVEARLERGRETAKIPRGSI